ncbi:FAD-dependent oxidoreductase [Nocardioides bruguierae]|uniref:FAD-dependent oxidoreductase n=1 Tax=Nocardioides bruguierae TaxID=2945102 RepID=A0A9X2D9Y5_9ACTN|nr:FAD-dependent oxidoreductase [Nocardioides bruguierae]MCM0622017.1 FAD-dependent oxidoreductase [Nocardioides bruguierae]
MSSRVTGPGHRPGRLLVRVRGAGVVGLAVAEELLRRGHRVEAVDPTPGSGASHAAAGMLSPGGEAGPAVRDVVPLGRRSLRRWPALADRLGVGLHRTGTLLVAHDAGDRADLDRHLDLLTDLGEPAERLTTARLRALEPRLARVAGGAWLPEDHSVDPRAVVAALLRRVPVRPVASSATADAEVIATGAVLPQPWAHLVRPVRGEILRLRSEDPPERVVRGLVAGRPVYVVPRADGEVVVGATTEEHAGPPVVTAGGVHALLDDARRLLPGLDRAVLGEALARDRPGSADGLPLVGPAPGAAAQAGPRTVLASGLHRHGVLLAPLVAALVADHVEGRVDPVLGRLLDPGRHEPDSHHQTQTQTQPQTQEVR